MLEKLPKIHHPALLHSSLPILKETDFQHIGQKKIGKVRDIYLQKDKIILISTDRHSSFDRIIAYIPYKGQILNQMSAFWFENTKDIIPNHLLNIADPNVIVAKKCQPLPIEIIVRGYITGVTDTSLWSYYQKGQRNFGNFTLPEGLKKNQLLDKPVLTPTTKSEKHDKPVTPKEIIIEGILSEHLWNEIENKAIRLFERGQKIAKEAGLILVDTKYEFGIDENGKLMLIDEIHTPDSSRYWQAKNYHEKFNEGKEPEYFDKEFLRIWFKKNCDPYKDAVLPETPKEMILELSQKYIQIYEQITQQIFKADPNESIMDRIKKNLSPFTI